MDVESTEEGEDHVPCNRRRAYSENRPRSWDLASWEVAFLLPPSLTLTRGARLLLTVNFDVIVPGRLGYLSSSSEDD